MVKLFPHDRIPSAYDVDYRALYALGIRAVFFDIDNTLVPHDAPSDRLSGALVARLRQEGLLVYIISNNGEPRVSSFSRDAGCDGYVFKAGKPLPDGFNQALGRLGIRRDEAVYFGDQIFTDVAGGRNAGLWTILTRPMDRREPFHIRLKRIAELPIIAAYRIFRMFAKPRRPVPLLK